MDPSDFRLALRSLPTAVTVIAGMQSGRPTGMVIGSFAYVSMDPMLVGFFGDHRSTTLERLIELPRWSFNVLDDEHRLFVDDFRGPLSARFDRVPWSLSEGGLPVIDGSVVTIEATHHSTMPAGDHTLILASVDDTRVRESSARPLVYHQNELTALHPTTMARAG